MPPPPQPQQVSTQTAANKPVTNTKLPAIKETNIETDPQTSPTHFSWIFQHVSQVVELSIRILMTNQIEACLKESKIDELKKLEAKLALMIEFYMKEMNNYEQKVSKNAETSAVEKSTAGIIMNEDESQKLRLILKLTIYYRNICKRLISENAASITSPIWLSKLRYYYAKVSEKDCALVIKNMYSEVEFNYGFNYCSRPLDHVTSILYESDEVEKTINYLIGIVHFNSSPLLFGNYVSDHFL